MYVLIKGFAVVAEEIRKLAEGTKESLNQVSSIVDELKYKINTVQEQMNNNNEKSQKGDSILNETVKGLTIMNINLKSFTSNIMDISNASEILLTKAKSLAESNEEIFNITKNTMPKYGIVTEQIAQSASTSEEIEANINELRNIAENMNKLTE